MAKKPTVENTNFNVNEAKIEQIDVEAFLDKYMKLYSAHSNVRGLPFIGDGFKDAQRKAMWGMLKRGVDAKKISVERVSSLCAAETDYHHGVGSMQGTIVGLAQDFAGSNNLNLLVPDGQFGSRRSHGASAARYIETMIHQNFRMIFRKEDDTILEQRCVGELKIEPKYFIPLLPMTLINGAEGMGTGHSTHIFSYSPKVVRENIIKVLSGHTLTDHVMVPTWKDFIGKVTKDRETGQVTVTGDYKLENTTTLRVTELPVGVSCDAYEAVLNKLEDQERDAPIKSWKNASDNTGFDFIVTIPRTTSYLDRAELIKIFKLTSRDTENFTMWGTDGLIKKYRSAEHVLTEFVEWRLLRYEERRQKLMSDTQHQIDWLIELMRFITFYLNSVQLFKNTGKAELIKLLEDAKFTDVDKLLSQQIWSLTKDRISDLEQKLETEREKLSKLQSSTPVEMYKKELGEMKLDF